MLIIVITVVLPNIESKLEVELLSDSQKERLPTEHYSMTIIVITMVLPLIMSTLEVTQPL